MVLGFELDLFACNGIWLGLVGSDVTELSEMSVLVEGSPDGWGLVEAGAGSPVLGIVLFSVIAQFGCHCDWGCNYAVCGMMVNLM